MTFPLRLAAGLIAFLAASIYGVAVTVFRRDRSRVAHDYAQMLTRLMLPVMGIRVEVHDRPNLDRFRPCIFIANHQSLFDAPILAGLFPENTVVIGKKELRKIPLFGWIYTTTGNLLIDRAHNPSAVQRMKEAELAVVERGVSVWMFPEGTRGRTPGEMLPLKKGAFYLAIGTGMPLVPIVASPVRPLVDLRRGRMRPGTIRVRVLPPVPTSGLSEADIPALLTQIQREMGDALRALETTPD
jgi:1-acyl-sn-glycerol-3-phosphate acyltransferase